MLKHFANEYSTKHLNYRIMANNLAILHLLLRIAKWEVTIYFRAPPSGWLVISNYNT